MEASGKLWGACNPEEEERYREIVRQRIESSPYYRLIGLTVTGLGCGWSTFEMEASERLFNVGGIVHGGAIASIADAAAGVALATMLEAGREWPVTIEIKVNFCSPATEGKLEARGEVVQKGGRIAVCDVEVTQGERLVAKGMATCMVLTPAD